MESVAPSERNERGSRAVIASLIVVAVFVAFWPALSAGFVDWDDDRNFLQNPSYRGLSFEHLKWMATTFHQGHYQPLSWLTFGIDHALWGMDARGYHLTNILVHACTAVAFFFLALRLFPLCSKELRDKRLVLASVFAALLFAVHPLRVESVAWVTERRDVLSGFFLVLSILAYVSAMTSTIARARRSAYALSLVSLFLSLTAKASGMGAPLVLLAMDVWPLRRPWKQALVDKIPFVLLVVPFAALALWAQDTQGHTLSTIAEHGRLARLAQASYAVVFYPTKTLLPFGLAAIYEMPLPIDPFSARFLIAMSCALFATVLLFVFRRRVPAAWTAWFVFLVLAAPTSGIAQAGPQLVADRYSYHACMSFALLAAGALFAYAPRVAPLSSEATVASAVVILFFGSLAWRQTRLWHDTGTLFEHVLEIDPSSYIAHTNLGFWYFKEGDLDSSEAEARAAISAQPANPRAHMNLGNVLFARSDLAGSIAEYEKALALSPRDAETHKDIAAAYLMQGRGKLAIEHYRAALDAKPNWADVELGLAWILATHKNPALRNGAEAVTFARGAIERNGTASASQLDTLAAAYAEAGRFDEARSTAQRALEMSADRKLSAEIEARLELYAAGKAYHGPEH